MKAPYTIDQLIEELEDVRARSPRLGQTEVKLGEFTIYSVKLDGDVCRLSYNEERCPHCGRYDCDPECDMGCPIATEEWEASQE